MRELVDLVWPRCCVGCEDAASLCCEACHERMYRVGPVRVDSQVCPPGMPATWAGTTYGDTAAVVIRAWKDEDRPHLGALLAPLVARALRQAVAESPTWRRALREHSALAVPVPSRPAGTRRRGRYPVQELLRRLFARSHGSVRPLPALVVSPAVRDQAGLGRAARARNLAGSMRVRAAHREAVRGAPVVLVDDVVTTGATVVESARALSRCGAGPLIAVSVAATPRHHAPPGALGAMFCDERAPG